MSSDIAALASFVFITTFTPGPNNITCASMGILFGYKSTLKYLLGIASGFITVMLLCGWISSALSDIVSRYNIYLRYIGAGYILWLAYHTLKASYSFKEEEKSVFGFFKGFLLQLLNPKAIIYGLTIYSVFFGSQETVPAFIILSATALTVICYGAVSTWTLFGTAIRKYMNRPRIKQAVNLALSLLLVYTAIDLSGILEIIFPLKG